MVEAALGMAPTTGPCARSVPVAARRGGPGRERFKLAPAGGRGKAERSGLGETPPGGPYTVATLPVPTGSIFKARSALRITATSISSWSKAPCTGVR